MQRLKQKICKVFLIDPASVSFTKHITVLNYIYIYQSDTSGHWFAISYFTNNQAIDCVKEFYKVFVLVHRVSMGSRCQ